MIARGAVRGGWTSRTWKPAHFFGRVEPSRHPAAFPSMTALSNKAALTRNDLHVRDAIIHALYLKLKSERETRETLLDAARSGAALEVLEAIASDPVPMIDEFGEEATVRAIVERFLQRPEISTAETIGVGR